MSETLYQDLVINKKFRFEGTDNDKHQGRTTATFIEDNGGKF